MILFEQDPLEVVFKKEAKRSGEWGLEDPILHEVARYSPQVAFNLVEASLDTGALSGGWVASSGMTLTGTVFRFFRTYRTYRKVKRLHQLARE